MWKRIIFSLILIAVIQTSAAEVQIIELHSEPQVISQGECTTISLGINYINDVNCIISDFKLEIENQEGLQLECSDLPTEYGIYNEKCQELDLKLRIDETNFDNCYTYGGDNQYDYKIDLCFPIDIPEGEYTIKATVDSRISSET